MIISQHCTRERGWAGLGGIHTYIRIYAGCLCLGGIHTHIRMYLFMRACLRTYDALARSREIYPGPHLGSQRGFAN